MSSIQTRKMRAARASIHAHMRMRSALWINDPEGEIHAHMRACSDARVVHSGRAEAVCWLRIRHHELSDGLLSLRTVGWLLFYKTQGGGLTALISQP